MMLTKMYKIFRDRFPWLLPARYAYLNKVATAVSISIFFQIGNPSGVSVQFWAGGLVQAILNKQTL